MNKQKVIAVAGPTASGKTSLAVFLARELGGEVVSADSMQIYKGMDIATAKPTIEEMEGIPHHLIGHVDVNEPYNVARYISEAKECINDIAARGKVPILAGGTGLYIDSLLYGVEFFDLPDNTKIRNELKQRLETEGAQSLLSELYDIDKETADSLHINNIGRIIRALEVYYLTGETMSQMKKRSREKGSEFEPLYICIEFSDRQKLYDRIDKRVDIMLENGLLEEAGQYINMGQETTSRQAIGYKELKPYFDGSLTLDDAIDNLKKETRHYAKRQLTWFRRNEERFVISPDTDSDFLNTALNKAKEFLKG